VARIRPLDREEAPASSQAEFDKQIRAHGRMTNMKRTLAHSWPALRALMEWYPLRDEVVAFLGAKLADLYSHANFSDGYSSSPARTRIASSSTTGRRRSSSSAARSPATRTTSPMTSSRGSSRA